MNPIYDNIEDMGLTPDYQSWESAASPFFEEAINMTNPTTIIEVGSWKGVSAIKMASLMKQRGKPFKIYCVDTWLGSADHLLDTWMRPKDWKFPMKHGYPQVYFQFLTNVKAAGHHDVIEPITATSTEGARILARKNVSAELIYIDGSHEYEDTYQDLCFYIQLLKPLGILFGDDFRSHIGVFHAAMRFAHERKLTLGEQKPFFILRKP